MSSGVIAFALLAAMADPAVVAVPAKLVSGTITSADYPPNALARGSRGTTKARLTVTAEGRATDCSIYQSSGDAELDALVCPLALTRMRFSPALDRDGNPVPMPAILPVRWEIEPIEAPPANSSR